MMRRFALASLFVAIALAPSWLTDAQEDAAQDDVTGEDLPTAEEIEARIEALESATDLDVDQRAAARDELGQALRFLSGAQTERTQADAFAQETRSAPARLAEIDARLRIPPASLRINPDSTIDDLFAELEAANERLRHQDIAKREVDQEDMDRRARREQIPLRVPEAENRLEDVRAALRAGADPGEPPALAEARRIRLLAEQAALVAELNRLDQELASYEARRQLMSARQTLAARDVAMTQRAIATLEGAITRRRADEAQASVAYAEEELADANSAAEHPLVIEAFERNVELSEELARITNALIVLAQEEAGIDVIAGEIRAHFADSRGRVERVGLTEAIGLHLRNLRERLPDLVPHQRRRAQIDEEMNAAQRAVSESEYRMEQLEPPEDAAHATIVEHDFTSQPLSEAAHEEVESSLADAFDSQQSDLRDLIIAYNDYIEALLEVDTAESRLIEQARAYRTFIDERILWIQSAEPIAPRDAGRAWEAARWLVDPDVWWRILQLLWSDVRAQPVINVSWALLLIILIVIQPRLRRALEEIAKKTERSRTDKFGLTVAAALWTLLLAAEGPLVLAAVGWRLFAAAGDNPLAAAVSQGLERAAVMLLASELIRNLCRSKGIAEAHFGWRSQNLSIVRRNLRWLVPILVPVVFIVAVTEVNEEHRDSLGRFAFLLGMVALALFILRVLHPMKGILYALVARYRGGWIDNLKYLWFSAFVATPLVLAITAAFGWFYTAVQLERLMVQTTYLILLVLVAQAFLLRWLFVAQRKMAVEQARKKLAAARAEAEEKAAQGMLDSADPAPPPTPPVPEGQSVPESVDIDVAAVSAQTRKLLNTLVGFTIAIGVVLVWVDVLPAFSMFREVVLWSETETTTVMANPLASLGGEGASVGGDAAPEGDAATNSVFVAQTTSPTTVETVRAVTLADLIIALVIFAITIAIGRNIPGVLEITLLQRLPITPGGRYAFTTIARYAIVIVGIVLAFNAIGIGWSKVQWLAAAITVGLGFGLQEIFANFVSGLIILFERPIRVGDTVTVGDVNGTVSRIRMRATTVVDWDRKELIIPNKEFVTGQVINWTLTDSIMRVKIPVGVDYGSDVELVKRTLLQLAAAHPHVLEEPPPKVMLLAFGSSSLDFELRVFVPHIDYYHPVRDELNVAIERAFGKLNIGIAYPHTEVHIRSIHAELPIKQVERAAEADAAKPQAPDRNG